MVVPLRVRVGGALRDLRLARRQTQEGTAEALGVTARYYAGVERGERNLTLDTLERLADDLGVPVEVVLGSRSQA
ncbi:MAG: helix-turn-helix domain-containing protein [Promicromonosporaceae bacterium]|nr:helix-turn-helix domain-containing protein [Promicromonosporaceae bacterium]